MPWNTVHTLDTIYTNFTYVTCKPSRVFKTKRSDVKQISVVALITIRWANASNPKINAPNEANLMPICNDLITPKTPPL